jgi:hypothetical protein
VLQPVVPAVVVVVEVLLVGAAQAVLDFAGHGVDGGAQRC